MTRQEIVEKVNEISSKYRFRDAFEIESDEVLDFCRGDFTSATYRLTSRQ